MKKRNNKSWIIAGGGAFVLVAVLVIALFQWPVNQFTLDVNPSLEITTNRLEQVIDVKALNEDGREFLEGYEKPGRNLEVVINDLVDRMILTGHITGGQDNIVMITVDSDELDSAYIQKVNEAIAAFLQNRQLEYRILNQGLTEIDDEEREHYEEVSRGKLTLMQKLMAKDEELTVEQLREISLKDLLTIAEELNISPNELFARILYSYENNDNGEQPEEDESFMPTDEEDSVIGWKQATEIALEEVGGGMVIEFEYDMDDRKYEIEIMYDGFEYELEIHAYTGEIQKFDRDSDDDAYRYEAEAANLIGMDRAIEIAKENVGGGILIEFEFDLDDREYEIEIKYNGYEYEIKMDAYTGRIIKFDGDKDYNYRDEDEEQEVIGRDLAIEIVKEKIGGGVVMEFEYDMDDGEYEIEINYDGYEYEIKMDAYTGRIIEFERDEDDDYRDKDEEEGVIGMDRAIEIVKAKIGGGVVMEFEYDMDDGEYEMEIKYDGYTYEIEMDAYTGSFIEFERDEEDDAYGITGEKENVIGRKRAVAIAIEKIGGGVVIEFEYDMDDGEYEIEIMYNGEEYDVEIDAYSGEILDFDD